MSLIMLGAGLFKQIYAAEIGYVYAGGERIARSVDNEQLQSYVADSKGSVLNLTDGTAPVAGVTYQYDAYGLVLKSPAMDIPNPFQYNGEWTDNFSQLQYLRARFYTPTLMRFVQQDSYDLANRFNYGDGNPIVNSDPSGHFASSWLNYVLGGIGLVVGVVGAYYSGGSSLNVGAGVASALISGGGQIADQVFKDKGVIKGGGATDQAITWGSFGLSIALPVASNAAERINHMRLSGIPGIVLVGKNEITAENIQNFAYVRRKGDHYSLDIFDKAVIDSNSTVRLTRFQAGGSRSFGDFTLDWGLDRKTGQRLLDFARMDDDALMKAVAWVAKMKTGISYEKFGAWIIPMKYENFDFHRYMQGVKVKNRIAITIIKAIGKIITILLHKAHQRWRVKTCAQIL